MHCLLPASAQSTGLRIVTINAWSGLDYNGFLRFGEYESPGQREARFDALLRQTRELKPDVIFVQEANPLPAYAKRFAGLLGYSEIHQVCNAGIQIGPLGLPGNLVEGLVILARTELGLEYLDLWKLSGSIGLYSDVFSVHFDESNFALVGRIEVENSPVYLVNIHLIASPCEDTTVVQEWKSLLREGVIAQNEYLEALKVARKRKELRFLQIRRLLKRLEGLPSGVPVIVAGDLYARPGTVEVRELVEGGELLEVEARDDEGTRITWDASDNENIAYSFAPVDARGRRRRGYERLSALAARCQACYDYILLGNRFRPEDIHECRIVFTERAGGVIASDHYGLMAEVELPVSSAASGEISEGLVQAGESVVEPLPILSHDTDTGTGYGVKLFVLNKFGGSESFDLVAFNSTNGERWYKLVFSWPDFELRQGRRYPFSLDLVLTTTNGSGTVFRRRQRFKVRGPGVLHA